jgi:putative MATE family efflux protein
MTKEDRKRYLILKDPNIYKGLIFLAFPLMVNNFIKTIHDIVDMFFVSKIENYSAESVSAISITFPVTFIFISLGIGLSIAGTSFISQLIGGNQRQEARRYATNLFAISVVLGFILNIIGFFIAPLLMQMIGAEGYLLEESTAYIQIRSFELISVFIFFAFTAIRQSDGDTITPVIFGVITMMINIVLSPILISVFDLGVEGAAYATLIGNSIILPFILYQLFFSKTGITISLKEFKPSKEISYSIIKTAIPASTGQALTAVGFLIMNGIILSYGTQTVAAFSVGNRISSMILHPVMAIGGILAAYIGQNIGNANPERARETFHKAMILSIGVMVFFSTILMFLREPLASIFLSGDQVALDLAVKYLFFLLAGLPLMAIFQTYFGAFNGSGKTTYTFIVSITRLWLMRIPLILIFKYFTDMGSSGIWTAMLISNFLIAFVGFYFYKKLDFKPKMELDL